MRLFVAAELPPATATVLTEQLHALARAVDGRFVAPDSLHLTLAFLGEVAPERIDDIAAAMTEACAGVSPIPLAMAELGVFGRRGRRGQTLWQGFEASPALEELDQHLREQLRRRDIAYDEKPFAAHVTLARRVSIDRAALDALNAQGYGQVRGQVRGQAREQTADRTAESRTADVSSTSRGADLACGLDADSACGMTVDTACVAENRCAHDSITRITLFTSVVADAGSTYTPRFTVTLAGNRQ